MNISTLLPTTGDTEWTLLVKILLSLQQGGGGGGSVKFGDPSNPGAQISGALSYDNLGNVWVDLNPAGGHDWEKVVTAMAPADPAAEQVPIEVRAEPMVVEPIAAPTLEQPPVVLPVSRWDKFRKGLARVSMWIAALLHL